MKRKFVGLNRKLAILLAVFIFLGMAAYLDVYHYLSFVNLIQKIDSQLRILTELDKDVTSKRYYLSKLENVVQPRISLSAFQEYAKNAGLNFARNQDGSYKIEGICKADDAQKIIEIFLRHPNLRLKSLSIVNKTEIPLVVPGLPYEANVVFALEFWGVMER